MPENMRLFIGIKNGLRLEDSAVMPIITKLFDFGDCSAKCAITSHFLQWVP
jgi:hypothetical protein